MLDNGAKTLTNKVVLELVYEPEAEAEAEPPPSDVNETKSEESSSNNSSTVDDPVKRPTLNDKSSTPTKNGNAGKSPIVG